MEIINYYVYKLLVCPLNQLKYLKSLGQRIRKRGYETLHTRENIKKKLLKPLVQLRYDKQTPTLIG